MLAQFAAMNHFMKFSMIFDSAKSLNKHIMGCTAPLKGLKGEVPQNLPFYTSEKLKHSESKTFFASR